MSIIAAFVVPHPPLVVPGVGSQDDLAKVARTVAAYEEVSRRISALAPDTLVISSPHVEMYADYLHVAGGQGARGSFARFGAPQARCEVTYDQEFVRALCEAARREGIPAGTAGERSPELDHGTIVPLHFIWQAWDAVGSGAGSGADTGAAAAGAGVDEVAATAGARIAGGVGAPSPAPRPRVVRLGISGLSPLAHYRMGQLVARVADALGRRVVYVASGDLSHKLLAEGPCGFAAEGPQFDAAACEAFRTGDFLQLMTLDPGFCERAAECGLRSFIMMAGALDRTPVTPELLSHEGPFGVGYGVAAFTPTEGASSDPARDFDEQYLAWHERDMARRRAQESPWVALARRALEAYVTRGERVSARAELDAMAQAADAQGEAARDGGDVKADAAPTDAGGAGVDATREQGMQSSAAREQGAKTGTRHAAPAFASNTPDACHPLTPHVRAELEGTRAGCFVSLKKDGQLRGCIGTTGPTKGSLAEEICANAVAAGTRDPRFDPVRPEELPELVYDVDVLGTPEPVADARELDARRFGVIVSASGGRRGLLLPDLDGVDTVEEQVRIAARKGGIDRTRDRVSLERFEVTRHL